MLSRREALVLLAAAGLAPSDTMSAAATQRNALLTLTKPLRVRTITTGVDLATAADTARIEAALATLRRGRQIFEAAGYELQTTRLAITPFLADADRAARDQALAGLERIDQMAAAEGAVVSIGPLLKMDRHDPALADWAVELVRSTRTISFSVVVASARGVHGQAAASAAEIMNALARALPDGIANFRFAAAANIPAGTPFFPVAWHQGADSLAVGLESAAVVEDAFRQATDPEQGGARLKELMNQALAPIERLGGELAGKEGRAWLGIDTSPAPAKDRSIAAAIEALTHAPFGSASTLQACSIITAAIKSLDVKTCGYSGLMLPVLEDPLLAQRAGEGRYGIRDLLLYSSVCGTGLDVVPIPGDTPVATLTGLLKDVAALSARLVKPLSARLFIVPGKKAGDIARFTDPVLTDSVVMKVD